MQVYNLQIYIKKHFTLAFCSFVKPQFPKEASMNAYKYRVTDNLFNNMNFLSDNGIWFYFVVITGLLPIEYFENRLVAFNYTLLLGLYSSYKIQNVFD